MEHNPFSASYVRKTLQANDLWLSKDRGQNYLVDKNIVQKIVAMVPAEQTVFEVGTGFGALTVLLGESHKTYSMEIDRGIYQLMRTAIQVPSIHLILADFLEYDLDRLEEQNMVFVSNLPYSISGEAIKRFIDAPQFNEGIIMIQKEFYERMSAPTGGKNFGVFAVLCQTWLDIYPSFSVPRSCFFPAPSVDSMVLRIVKKPSELTNQEAFRDFLKAAFQSKRKTLSNNLKRLNISADQITAAGYDPSERPENISPADWVTLFKQFS